MHRDVGFMAAFGGALDDRQVRVLIEHIRLGNGGGCKRQVAKTNECLGAPSKRQVHSAWLRLGGLLKTGCDLALTSLGDR